MICTAVIFLGVHIITNSRLDISNEARFSVRDCHPVIIATRFASLFIGNFFARYLYGNV